MDVAPFFSLVSFPLPFVDLLSLAPIGVFVLVWFGLVCVFVSGGSVVVVVVVFFVFLFLHEPEWKTVKLKTAWHKTQDLNERA